MTAKNDVQTYICIYWCFIQFAEMVKCFWNSINVKNTIFIETSFRSYRCIRRQRFMFSPVTYRDEDAVYHSKSLEEGICYGKTGKFEMALRGFTIKRWSTTVYIFICIYILNYMATTELSSINSSSYSAQWLKAVPRRYIFNFYCNRTGSISLRGGP